MGGFVVLGAVVWLVCVIVTVTIAGQKGRRQWVWALLAIVTGPIAMFAVFVMGPVKGSATGGSGSGGAKHTDPHAELYEVPRKKH